MSLKQQVLAKLSPNGRWLVVHIEAQRCVGRTSFDVPDTGRYQVIADDVKIMELERQRLVLYELGGGQAPKLIHEASHRRDSVGSVVVLDEGTVIAARMYSRELWEWRRAGSLQTHTLFEKPGPSHLTLRRDGRQLLVSHRGSDDSDREDPDWEPRDEAFTIDPETWTPERVPELDSTSVYGWTRDHTHVIGADVTPDASHSMRLVRVDMSTRRRELLEPLEPYVECMSAAWFVWSHIEAGRETTSFARMATEPDARLTAMPALDGYLPWVAIGEHQFLCKKDGGGFLIADVRRDLGVIIGEVNLPTAGFLKYSAALDALVCGNERVCEIRNLDGTLRDSIALVDD